MSAQFPETETVMAALSLAVRAPSVYNSQPWRWRLGQSNIHLHADPSLQLRSADPDGRDMAVSCGAALNHCAVAFAALGWHAKVRRFPDPADLRHVATLEFAPYPATELDVALAAAIPRRRTDRRRYSSSSVPEGDIALMKARAARAGVMFRRVEALTHLRELAKQAALRHAQDYEYLVELSKWSGRYGSTAGVPARNTLRPDSTTGIPGRAFAGPALAQPPGAESADEHAVVVALGTDDDDDLARLRAGEATSLVLLTATALGLASCPITEPLEIADIREQVRAEVFGTDGFPQILLRIGWAPVNADPLPPTPRRPLSEVVTLLNRGTST